ncbi:suppressor of fused homolog [Amphibalanus amphitrite]|uniref:suppressor of fused homolog n=1 Tax=Amphibalanus amphitrite TaxID=1232801 RepID=UPI001C901D93|nr:suppressor of fused homolog [Amphibalanus amphitrite]XP_043225612.1 suppressor of fused homolog [Amphibalanus amphitrite]
MEACIPPGLCALYKACSRLYPDQLNPLQITAVRKYWLGGPDPLDYISMYWHDGGTDEAVTPHWHYVSFGLSDLHGDGRLHEPSGPDTPSGLGLELTFRLRREPTETTPPTWPAAMMQALAKYVLQSGNLLVSGDHVSYHVPLDGGESRLQHILLASDPDLGQVTTPFGPVQFVQIVGITPEELEAVQHWNGSGMVDIMKRCRGAGGPLLVTDMRRGESVFELEPAVREEVECGIDVEGSNLSGVSAWLSWARRQSADPADPAGTAAAADDDAAADQEDAPREVSEKQRRQIRDTLQRGLLQVNSGAGRSGSAAGAQPLEAMYRRASDGSSSSGDATDTPDIPPSDRLDKLESLHLSFNLESGLMLPLALRGRLKHGRHFTFKSMAGDCAVTLVSPSVQGSVCTEAQPYVARGRWLQVRLAPALVDRMLCDLNVLSDPDQVVLPQTFSWEDENLAVTIVSDPV